MRPLALMFAAAWVLAGPAGAPAQALRERASLRVPATLWDRFRGVECLALSPDGGTLATGGRLPPSGAKGEVILWDVGAGRQARALPVARPGIEVLTFSPDGRRLAAGVSGGAVVWDLPGGKEVRALRWQL